MQLEHAIVPTIMNLKLKHKTFHLQARSREDHWNQRVENGPCKITTSYIKKQIGNKKNQMNITIIFMYDNEC